MNIRIEGIDRVIANIQKKYDNTEAKMSKGIAKGCKIVEGEAKAMCPVDTGQLRASITSEVSGNTGIVGTSTSYASYVCFGTRYMHAQPYLVPALKSKQAEVIQAIIESLK